jgi:hypothetical protein
MYLACSHRVWPSGASSFTLIADSGPSSLSLQDIDRMARNSPGNGSMQCILHVSVELGCLESSPLPLSPILTRAPSAFKISTTWPTVHLEMDKCDVSCIFPSRSAVWSALLRLHRHFWPKLPQLPRYRSRGPQITRKWVYAVYYAYICRI